MSKASSGLNVQLPITSDNLLTILKDDQVEFKLYKHKPLYSVSESKIEQELIFPINPNNVQIKNLYLKDKKKNNYLFVFEQDKIIDLKELSHLISATRFSFGSSQRLFENLGVFPGAVSPFCMLNGVKNNVKFFCDYGLKQYKKIYLHPFVNDMTICLNIDDLENFLKQYHIFINWVNL